MTRVALAGGVCLALALTTPAYATPLTWSFGGAAATSQVAAFPVGTPVSIDWTANPATPNACASIDPQVGIYFSQTLTETVGGATYTIGGILTVGTTLARGCFGAADTGVRLNLISWNGPNVAEGPLLPAWPCCNVPSMQWLNSAPASNYPLLPPASAFVQGPYFAGGLAAITAAVQPVPEPATMTLVLVGALALRRRIMSR